MAGTSQNPKMECIGHVHMPLSMSNLMNNTMNVFLQASRVIQGRTSCVHQSFALFDFGLWIFSLCCKFPSSWIGLNCCENKSKHLNWFNLYKNLRTQNLFNPCRKKTKQLVHIKSFGKPTKPYSNWLSPWASKSKDSNQLESFVRKKPF